MTPKQQRDDWRVGARVSRRKDGEELGTIVEANDNVKVKWDDGHTSYFLGNKPANLQVVKAKP